jgi:hypothetical protein
LSCPAAAASRQRISGCYASPAILNSLSPQPTHSRRCPDIGTTPNLAPFACRRRATGQRTYCPCSVCSEPEAHPLQAVRGLAAVLSHANATGNPGGLRFARRLGTSPLDGHCGPAAPRRLHPRSRRTQVLTVFRLPAGGAVRQGSRSSRSRRAGTGHYLPQPSSHRFHLAKAGLLLAGYRVVASVVEMTPGLGLLVHHGDRELAVVEMPAELIAVAEDRDLQRIQRVGAAV